jgi:hypothetical protein
LTSTAIACPAPCDIFVDPSSGNYRLMSTSVAAASGGVTTPASADLDGNSRPQNGTYSIGAFEYSSGYAGSAARASASADVGPP